MMGLVCLCGVAFITMYTTVVGLTIPQLPGWAQDQTTQWMLDIPQFSEQVTEDSYIDNAPGDNSKSQYSSKDKKGGSGGSDSSGGGDTEPVFVGPVPWNGTYVGPNGIPDGFPLWGPVTHPWGGTFDAPLIGCEFHDPHYKNHTGFDSPVSVSTPIHSTIGGKVVWAGYTKGGWGRLVVIENGDYQIWLLHLHEIDVQVGNIVEPGQIIGLSGGDPKMDGIYAGHSSGAHLHYGVKKKTGPDSYVWVDPTEYFDVSKLTKWGCAG